jgi:hypothetical protein
MTAYISEKYCEVTQCAAIRLGKYSTHFIGHLLEKISPGTFGR